MSIVVVPMMPAMPMVSVVFVVVIVPVMRICRPNINVNSFVCFRFGGCQRNQAESNRSEKQKSFHT